jgi:DNA-binding FadR family transcriptional regulator
LVKAIRARVRNPQSLVYAARIIFFCATGVHITATLSWLGVSGKPQKPSPTRRRLNSEIAKGNLMPGDKLPNEKDLAVSLGISRTPIREAIKTLEVSGLVSSRHGYGTYISNDDIVPVLPLMMFKLYLQDSTPEMLMEVALHFRSQLCRTRSRKEN